MNSLPFLIPKRCRIGLRAWCVVHLPCSCTACPPRGKVRTARHEPPCLPQASSALTIAIIGVIIFFIITVTYCAAFCCARCGGNPATAICCRGAARTAPKGEGALAEHQQKESRNLKILFIGTLGLCLVHLLLGVGIFTSVSNMGKGVTTTMDAGSGVLALIGGIGTAMVDLGNEMTVLEGNIQAAVDSMQTAGAPPSSTQGLVNAKVQTASASVLLVSAEATTSQVTQEGQKQIDDAKTQVQQNVDMAGFALAGAVCATVVFMAIALTPIAPCVHVFKCSMFLNKVMLLVLWLATAVLCVLAMAMSDFCADPQHSLVHSIGNGQPTLAYYVECTNADTPITNPNFTAPGLYGEVANFYYSSRTSQALVAAEVGAAKNSSLASDANVQAALVNIETAAAAVDAKTGVIVALVACGSVKPKIVEPLVKGMCTEFSGEGLASLWAVLLSMSCLGTLLALWVTPLCHAHRHPGGHAARQAMSASDSSGDGLHTSPLARLGKSPAASASAAPKAAAVEMPERSAMF